MMSRQETLRRIERYLTKVVEQREFLEDFSGSVLTKVLAYFETENGVSGYGTTQTTHWYSKSNITPSTRAETISKEEIEGCHYLRIHSESGNWHVPLVASDTNHDSL